MMNTILNTILNTYIYYTLLAIPLLTIISPILVILYKIWVEKTNTINWKILTGVVIVGYIFLFLILIIFYFLSPECQPLYAGDVDVDTSFLFLEELKSKIGFAMEKNPGEIPRGSSPGGSSSGGSSSGGNSPRGGGFPSGPPGGGPRAGGPRAGGTRETSPTFSVGEINDEHDAAVASEYTDIRQVVQRGHQHEIALVMEKTEEYLSKRRRILEDLMSESRHHSIGLRQNRTNPMTTNVPQFLQTTHMRASNIVRLDHLIFLQQERIGHLEDIRQELDKVYKAVKSTDNAEFRLQKIKEIIERTSQPTDLHKIPSPIPWPETNPSDKGKSNPFKGWGPGEYEYYLDIMKKPKPPWNPEAYEEFCKMLKHPKRLTDPDAFKFDNLFRYQPEPDTSPLDPWAATRLPRMTPNYPEIGVSHPTWRPPLFIWKDYWNKLIDDVDWWYAKYPTDPGYKGTGPRRVWNPTHPYYHENILNSNTGYLPMWKLAGNELINPNNKREKPLEWYQILNPEKRKKPKFSRALTIAELAGFKDVDKNNPTGNLKHSGVGIPYEPAIAGPSNRPEVAGPLRQPPAVEVHPAPKPIYGPQTQNPIHRYRIVEPLHRLTSLRKPWNRDLSPDYEGKGKGRADTTLYPEYRGKNWRDKSLYQEAWLDLHWFPSDSDSDSGSDSEGERQNN